MPRRRSSAASDELSAARRLLRRLVQVMATPISPQERLDRMVSMIAADIVAEVCSAYVLRGGDISSCSPPRACAEPRCTRPGCGSARAWSA